MLSQKLFRWMHKCALLALLFASLAPSVSHALAGQGSASGFMQEICGTNGKKLFIQVMTTQGQHIQTSLDLKPANQSKSISQHMQHCPFCHAGIDTVALPLYNAAYTLYLQTMAAVQPFDYAAPLSSHDILTAHLTRAPPNFS